MENPKNRRALRRHHRTRLIAKRTMRLDPYWGRAKLLHAEPIWTPSDLCQLARTPKPCSCVLCGNPRRIFRGLSVRETSDLEAIKREVV